jgi:hypothetical protein
MDEIIERELPEDEAWGGFLIAQEKLKYEEPFSGIKCVKWVLPDVRITATRMEGEVELPCMKLLYNGILVILEVKKSSIPNAGYGVFASCQLIDDSSSSKSLILKSGSLIDIGVYGPLRKEDCKKQNIFVLKSL